MCSIIKTQDYRISSNNSRGRLFFLVASKRGDYSREAITQNKFSQRFRGSYFAKLPHKTKRGGGGGRTIRGTGLNIPGNTVKYFMDPLLI